MASSAIARETIGAIGRPLALIALGAMFLIDYASGYAVSQTWPVILILLGLVLVLQSFSGPSSPEPRSAPAPRRKSLFGPLFLIGIGVVLLAKNLDPSITLRGWFAAYWPWILIVWGGFRVLEVLFSRGLGRPAPRGLGFGAVVMVVLLVIAGSAARHDFQRAWDIDIEADGFGVFDPSVKVPVDHSIDIEPGTTVVLEDLRGKVQVTAIEGSQLRIRGSAELWGRRNKHDPPELLIEVEQKGSETWVRTREDDRIDSRDVRYDVEISLPPEVGLRSESGRARLVVEDIAEAVEIHAGRGKIALKRIGGAVKVEAGRARRIEAEDLASSFTLEGNTGTIDLKAVAGNVVINGDLLGTVRLAGVGGSARVASRYGEMEAAAVPGRVELKVRSVSGSGLSGGLRLHSERWRRVHLEDVSGAANIKGGRMELELATGEEFGEIRAEVDKGDIRLQLPRDARFTVDARTERGRVRNFLGPSVRTARSGSSATLEGGPGGGPAIRLQTGRGTIVIEPVDADSDADWDADDEGVEESIRGTRIALEELRDCLPDLIRQWVGSFAVPRFRLTEPPA